MKKRLILYQPFFIRKKTGPGYNLYRLLDVEFLLIIRRFMSKGIFSDITIVFLLLILIIKQGYSQDVIIQPVRIMFYNVENLFDIYDDSLKDDNDFLPDGLMRWNLTRYNKKINSLYKTIVAAGEWNPPAVVAFCEVENRKVLEDLVYGTYLSKYNYGIIHEESPDQRGIDVCMIYRNDCRYYLLQVLDTIRD